MATQGTEEVRSRLLALGIESKARIVVRCRTNDLDSALRVMAIDQQVRTNRGMITETDTVFAGVGYGDDAQFGEAGELFHGVGAGGGAAPNNKIVAFFCAVFLTDAV